MLKHLAGEILKHTAASRRHLTPELVLRLVTPACPLWSAPAEDSPFKDPFWAFYWPGGQATARYILDNKHVTTNRAVLDVGCGCGAGAVAAAVAGAARVLANDIDPVATLAANLNAELNGVNINTSTEELVGTSCEGYDVVLIGDMFYDEQFAEHLFRWLRQLAEGGKTVLIGDPGRHGFTGRRRQHLTLLASYRLPEVSRLENNGYTDTSVWRINDI